MIAAVRSDILACDVRDESLIPIRFGVENKAVLTAVRGASESLGSDKDSQFQRHIESRKLGMGIEFCPRKIVDTEATLTDQIAHLIDSNLAAVVDFEGTSRLEPAIDHGEHGGMKKRPVLVIKRAIDEDVSRRLGSRPRLTFSPRPLHEAAHARLFLER